MSEKSPMWGGRFASGPADAMQRFNTSIEEDKRLAMEDIDGSIAHATMLGRQGIITADEAKTLVEGLESVRTEINDGVFTWDIALEDVHMNVEHRLRAKVGDVAGRLHTGRSRNDQVATDIRLYTRRALHRLADAISRVQAAFLDQSDGHAQSVMPGFTHLQIAQPISYSFYCMAYVEMFERDRDRLLSAADRLNECPLGGAALAGTPHPIDRQYTADALGFSAPAANVLDATASRDFMLDAIAAGTICAAHISRYAEEVVIYAAPQFGYLTVSDLFSTGSSIMPQKRNPDAAELLRAKCGVLSGAFTALTTMTKGVSLAYAKDLQDTKKPLMDGLDTLEEALEILAAMVLTMTPNPEAMLRDASRGFATATDVADHLAKEGVPFRDAHHIVGALVAKCEELGTDLPGLPLNAAQEISPRITAELLASLTPLNSIKAKQSAGSTHPDEVTRHMTRWSQQLAKRAS